MFFAAYNAKELANLATTLKIAGRSKMKKDDLYAAIAEVIDAAHGEALGDDRLYGSVECVLVPIPCPENIDGCEVMHFSKVVQSQVAVYALPVMVQDERYPLSAYLSEGQKRLPRRIKKELRKRGWL